MHLLDLGTARYRPNQELTNYLLARDPECTFPICHTPAVNCQIDHTQPVNHEPEPSAGGSTSPPNCRPRGTRHHQLKTHRGGWTITHNPDSSTTWTNTHRRQNHPPPKDHRPDTG